MPAAAAAALFVVYAATLAPGVTFWDAGEFIAAVDSLGIPHPPGTPLYILLARVASDALFFLDRAVATNLFSALCTAAAGGLTAWLVLRATGSRAAAVASALCAGGMSTVWLNATETEVYGAALLLSVAMIAAGERAGREWGAEIESGANLRWNAGEGSTPVLGGQASSARWTLLTVFLIALGAPLHASSLVAAPVAVYLAATDPAGRIDWRTGAVLTGATLIAGGLGSGRWPAMWVGVIILVACAVALVGVRRLAGGALAACAAASSAFLYLLLRARHEPAINQGNPSTRESLLDVMSRAQYDVAPLWPREAPVWLQLANLGQYADWQVALGVAPGIEPSIPRALVTLAFLALAVVGARWHRRRDERTWRAVALLVAAGSLGVAAWLNLKAGPTIGWGIIPDDAPHEARERDYFFSLAFWGWGIWAGMGALALAHRLTSSLARRSVSVGLGVALAAVPILLNWRAVNRRAEPEASLPGEFAIALLSHAPNYAVLFVWGDNDSYPLWYQQQVRQVRTDVTVVTLPLLRAGWYRAELARRHGLLDRAVNEWYGEGATVREIRAAAERAGRPIAASVSVPHEQRRAYLGELAWTGMIYRSLYAPEDEVLALVQDMPIDTITARHEASRLSPVTEQTPARSTDPTARYISRLLACPALAYAAGRGETVEMDSLATRCNFR